MSRTCVIVEDEIPSADRLEKMIREASDLSILAKLHSVRETNDWLANNSMPDLLFLDIQLSDGTGLDILSRISGFPKVIFTTAFDKYLLEAFKFNSIDYLLKPIKQDDLKRAIEKFHRLELTTDFSGLIEKIQTRGKGSYRTKFLIKVGERFHSVITEQIAYFLSEDGTTYLVDRAAKKFILDQSLDALENELDPKKFFRINRHMIVAFGSINSIESYFNNRLLLELTPSNDSDSLVSREKVKKFKDWLDA